MTSACQRTPKRSGLEQQPPGCSRLRVWGPEPAAARPAGRRKRHVKGLDLDPALAGLLGQRGCPRKAGSVRVTVCWHLVNMEHMPPSPRCTGPPRVPHRPSGTSGLALRTESALPEREGWEERRTGTNTPCSGGLGRGHLGSLPLGEAGGDEFLPAMKGLRPRELGKPAPSWQSGDLQQAWARAAAPGGHSGLLARTSLGCGVFPGASAVSAGPRGSRKSEAPGGDCRAEGRGQGEPPKPYGNSIPFSQIGGGPPPAASPPPSGREAPPQRLPLQPPAEPGNRARSAKGC